jgi:hypothetical protein
MDSIDMLIQIYFGEFDGVPTSDIYDTYLKMCEEKGIEPRCRIHVIREVGIRTGHKAKKKCITVFHKR